MLVEKIYTATLDVPDPENYCANPKAHVLSYLKRRFVGRNLGGAHIVEILKVLRRSDCKIKETDLSGEGYVDVEFQALVVHLARWDIVTGVEIVNRSPLIVGRSTVEGSVVMSFVPTPEVDTVRVGQVVSARVYDVQFSPNQTQVTAVGPLLTRDKAAPVYALTADLTRDDVRDLEPLVSQVQQLLEARADLVKARRDDVFFFETLLYAYVQPTAEPQSPNSQTIETKGVADWEGPVGLSLPDNVNIVNLLTVISEARDAGMAKVRGIWCRDLALYRSSPLTARVAREDTLPQGWKVLIASNPRTAFTDMLKTVYDFLKAVNEMVAVYDSREMIESHKNIWLAMRNAQSPSP